MKTGSFGILLLASALLSISSCERISTEKHGNDIDVPLEWNGYISFEAEPTKAALVTSMSEKDFGVFGFKYASNWTTYRGGISCFPNVFDSTPEQVRWSISKHTYSEIQEWEEKKYTFFGYYPWGLTNSGGTYSGTPYVDYSMTFNGSTSALQDVMTAMVADTDGSVSETVTMPFKHRLCCLRVEARNLNEPINGQTAADVRETLEDLTVTITSPMFGSVRIPLDPDMDITPSNVNSATKTFSIIGSTAAIVDYSNSSATSVISGDSNILFIPQTPGEGGITNLTGSISFTDKFGRTRPYQSTSDYIKVWDETNKVWINGAPVSADDISADVAGCSFVSTTAFEAGSVYSLVITFSNQAILVSVTETGGWEEAGQQITFE